MYRVTQNVLGCIIEHGWEKLKMYFQCVTRFCAILFNSNAFCDAHAVYRQYTRVFQKSGIYSFLFDVIGGSLFSIFQRIWKAAKRSINLSFVN